MVAVTVDDEDSSRKAPWMRERDDGDEGNRTVAGSTLAGLPLAIAILPAAWQVPLRGEA